MELKYREFSQLSSISVGGGSHRKFYSPQEADAP